MVHKIDTYIDKAESVTVVYIDRATGFISCFLFLFLITTLSVRPLLLIDIADTCIIIHIQWMCSFASYTDRMDS